MSDTLYSDLCDAFLASNIVLMETDESYTESLLREVYPQTLLEKSTFQRKLRSFTVRYTIQKVKTRITDNHVHI